MESSEAFERELAKIESRLRRTLRRAACYRERIEWLVEEREYQTQLGNSLVNELEHYHKVAREQEARADRLALQLEDAERALRLIGEGLRGDTKGEYFAIGDPDTGDLLIRNEKGKLVRVDAYSWGWHWAEKDD